MSDEILLEGKQFVSARRASEVSGYARDYVGQLARSGLIQAQRVGGLWYISLESLKGYQQNAEAYTPQVPQKTAQDMDATVSFDGKDYLAASRAAKLTGYNQDYIGQLARAGKVLSRQIGNRWYVERGGLLAHKAQKDALLGAVQAEAVGITRPAADLAPVEHASNSSSKHPELLTYITESMDLMPVLHKQEAESTANKIPVHVVHVPARPAVATVRGGVSIPTHRAPSAKIKRSRGIVLATRAAVALTFVIVLSYGIISLRDTSTYTLDLSPESLKSLASSQVAGAGELLEGVTSAVERLITPELNYAREE